jgi:hypothetical protein
VIRFRKTLEGKQVLIGVGLSDENVKRMKDGQPISFSLEELGVENHTLLIFTGTTEAEMKEAVKLNFGEIKEERQYK